MNRRTILATALTAPLAAGAAQARPAPAKPRAQPDLYVRDWGDGRPIVFLSPWGFSADAWHYQMLPLHRQGLRCVTYDRRGHGRSPDPGGGYDLDTLSDDLARVLDERDLKDVVLVAYSMGAGEATRYLSRHGRGRVARVLFVAPNTPCLAKGPDNPDGVDPAAFERARAVMARDFPAALAAGFSTFIDKGASDEVKTWLKGLMLGCSLKALIDCQHAFTTVDLRPEMARFPAPALVIHGDADQSAPLALTGRKTATLIPGCELKVYAGAPHGIAFTHTDQLNADIAAFARA
jgi:pimeloyl-ACP methyl ester carboxylesterase